MLLFIQEDESDTDHDSVESEHEKQDDGDKDGDAEEEEGSGDMLRSITASFDERMRLLLDPASQPSHFFNAIITWIKNLSGGAKGPIKVSPSSFACYKEISRSPMGRFG